MTRTWNRIAGCVALVLCLATKPAQASEEIRRAQDDIATLMAALDVFRAEYRRRPTAEEGFEALTTRPETITTRDWVQSLETVPLDPWGHPYQYVTPLPKELSNGPEDVGVYSHGPDGISGSRGNDRDDIASWGAPEDLGPRRGIFGPRGILFLGGAAILAAWALWTVFGRRWEPANAD